MSIDTWQLTYGSHVAVIWHFCADRERTVKVFKIKFIGPDGYAIGHSIGDSAAEVTLLCDKMREKLGINGTDCTLSLQWTDGSMKTVKATKVDLKIQGLLKDSKVIVLKNCYATSELLLPPRSLDVDKLKSQFPYLKKAQFESYFEVTPYLLIGSPHASAIESIGNLLEDGEGKPVGLKSKIGWSIYGGCPDEYNGLPYSVESIQTNDNVIYPKTDIISNEELYERFSYFSSIESLGIANKLVQVTEDEQMALDIVNEEMQQLSDGSIELPLVWRRIDNKIPVLPNNFRMVIKRQIAHEMKLGKNPTHLEAYNRNFKELIRDKYVRPACHDDIYGNWENVYYLPMSLVINVNKNPPKFRNVFDASAKYQDTSLNDHLLKGPDMLVDLLKPLLLMRKNKIAFSADIKAMFMRIKINMRDQQCQRVLWRECADDEFRVFVFSSMLFGPSSSPFCSQFVKNQTAEKWKSVYPKASDAIIHGMYMDDLLTSENSVEDALNVAKQCIEIFESINWQLISFQSNSLEFLKSLPQANVSQEFIPLLESENESCVTKVLGCVWDTKHDSFVYKFDKNLFIKIVAECQHKPTKRDQCSTIARIFDVLGLISHFVIRGKILLQRSWLEGIGWDDEISDENYYEWMKWLKEIENISKIKISRRFNDVENLSQSKNVELHIFCDAGGEAFAAVGYIVTTVGNNRYSNIVMAKAKVTPIRHKSRTQISEMPRLELCACLIAARLADTITKHYSDIKFKRYFWCDSEVALGWVIKPNHKLLKYAIAPVEEILEKTDRCEWRYVPTKLNVADMATKFKKIDFGDSNSVWYRGPNFLRLYEKHWPEMPSLLELPVVRKPALVNNVNIYNVLYFSTQKLPHVDCPVMSDYLIDRLSPSIKASWSKLTRATARAIKIWMDGVIPLLKSKQWNDVKTRNKIKEFNNSFMTLTPRDLERGEHFLIRKAQREFYTDEYECMRKGKAINNDELRKLNVFIDSEGLIRINSRVNLDASLYPQKYAPLVPCKSEITRVLLTHYHYEYKHICVESQMAAIQSKYWVPKLRSALKSIQFHCNFCSLQRARPYVPLMAPLPDFRTNPNYVAFETTGLDCMGPFVVMNYTKPKKVWVLIFVCTLTRFIHLHILDSLESIKVINAIAAFWSAHGPVRTFISDRGSNFVGAANMIGEDCKKTMTFLSEQHKVLNSELVRKFNVDWKLLPAHSPWMGAFYERLIKEVKRSIIKVLDNKKLTMIQLNIALNDAAHRINNRPLTHVSVSAEDEPPLTPHMLAKGRSGWPLLPGLPEPSPADIKNDKSIYKRGRGIADEIMRKFYSNYLPILTKRTKWYRDDKPLQIGDLVLLIEPNITRIEWKRGRVLKLYKGKDGRARVADIELSDKTVKKSRSVQRLAKIELKLIENAQ